MVVLGIVKCLGLSWDIGVSIFRDFCIHGNNGIKGCEDKEFIKGVLIFLTRLSIWFAGSEKLVEVSWA